MELISEEVFNVFMFDGKSPVSFVRDRRRFGRGQSAPGVHNRDYLTPKGLKRATRLLQGNVPKSTPIFDRAVDTAHRADALAALRRREADQGSSKEPEDEE